MVTFRLEGDGKLRRYEIDRPSEVSDFDGVADLFCDIASFCHFKSFWHIFYYSGLKHVFISLYFSLDHNEVKSRTEIIHSCPWESQR